MFLPELYGSEKSMYDSVINSCHRPIVTSQHGTEDMHATMYDNMTPKEDRWEFKVKRSRRWLNVAIYWYTFSVKKKQMRQRKYASELGVGLGDTGNSVCLGTVSWPRTRVASAANYVVAARESGLTAENDVLPCKMQKNCTLGSPYKLSFRAFHKALRNSHHSWKKKRIHVISFSNSRIWHYMTY